MLTTPKALTTLRHAFAQADHVLCNGRDLRLHSLSTGEYSDENAQQRELTTVGRIVATLWELDALGPELLDLRRYCAYPTATASKVLDRLSTDVLALSAVALEGISYLPVFAAETAQRRADQYSIKDATTRKARPLTTGEKAEEVAAAHARGTAVLALLQRLPTALARIKEAAQNGASLKAASAGLK